MSGLPDMSGWTVLDYLKHDPATRHIPVHVISGLDRTGDGFALGANTCSQKDPVSQSLDRLFPVMQDSMLSRPRKVLIVAGSDPMKKAIRDYLGALNLVLFDADSSASALKLLAEESIDGIVLDWVVSEVSGTEFIGQVQTPAPPVRATGDHSRTARSGFGAREGTASPGARKRGRVRAFHGAAAV